MSRTAVGMMRRRSSQSSPGSSQTETGGADNHGHDFGKSVHIISHVLTHICICKDQFPLFRKTSDPEFMAKV